MGVAKTIVVCYLTELIITRCIEIHSWTLHKTAGHPNSQFIAQSMPWDGQILQTDNVAKLSERNCKHVRSVQIFEEN